MSIRQNKNKKGDILPGSWVIDYYPQGRKGERIRQVISGVTEPQARGIEMQLRREQTGAIKNMANPRIIDALPHWLEFVRLHRSPKTYESILWALKHLEPHFGDYQVPHLTEDLFNRYKKKRTKTPRACNLEIDYIKILISWMVERKLCPPLPFKIERLPYQAPLPKIPSPKNLKKWLAEIKDDNKLALIYIILRSGLRWQEVSQLKWSDLDWNEGLIYYVSKGNKQRISVLPEETKKILEPYKDAAKPEDWLFVSKKTGKPYGSMKTMFKGASARSGVYIKGPHTLRHIAGTYTLESTGDLRLVQDTLGHSQIKMTQRYTQISVERLRQGQAAQADYTGQFPTDKNSGKSST